MSDNHDLLNDKDVCSFEEHEAENVCSNKDAVACGDSLPFNPHKISIFKVFMVSEMSDCHPFATLILKNITEHKKSTEPVELLPDSVLFQVFM